MAKMENIPISPEGSELESDFQKDGVPAKWAPGYPKIWGSENAKIGDPQGPRVEAVSLSYDEAFLAVAIDRDIFIFEANGLKVVETLKHLTKIANVEFSPSAAVNKGVHYNLVSGEEGVYGSDDVKPCVVMWNLNASGMVVATDDGGQSNLTMEVSKIRELANQASEAAISQLGPLKSWPQVSAIAEKIHDTLDSILADAARVQAIQSQWHTEGSIAGFGSRAFSSDGKLLCYNVTYHDKTGPHRRVVVSDVQSGKEKWHQQHHTDNIMWAGFSPDNSLIASSAWDQFLYVYSVESGQLIRDIGPSGGQNWNAAFSPNSKLIAVSRGSGGPTIFLWEPMNPQDFPAQLTGFRNWSRTMAWSPDGQLIAAGGMNGVIKVWNPHTTAIPQSRQAAKGQGYQEISDCLWLENGKRLAYKAGDSGLEIYDFEQNIKWRWGAGPQDEFARGYWAGSIIILKKRGWIGSIDQDGILRFWDMPS